MKTYRLLLFFNLAAVFVFLPFLYGSEEPSISVKAEVNKAFITIGDPILYTVTIKHHKDIKILSSVPFRDEDILKVKKSENFSKKEGDTLYTGKKFTLTAFSLGEFILTPIEIQYAEKGQTKSLKTDPIYITIKSVAEGEEKTDIRGIKGVVRIPPKYLKMVYAAGGLTGIALLAFLLLLFLRRKKPTADAPLLRKTLEESTIVLLNQLFDSDLIRRGKIKEYYLRLSEILKEYLEKRFHVVALEATTYEVMRNLKEKEVDGALREQLNEIFEFSDLAKFAKFKPEPIEILKFNQKAVQWIEAAKPKEI